MKIRLSPGIALLLFVSIQTFAQSNQPSNSNGILPNVIPSSTEAASLGKFGEWPVSEYTGIPDISIPLYSIKAGGFNLPIQLSYHAGGVKVDEVSSWAGTGWNLSAGGCISRTVVGLADDWADGLSQEDALVGGSFLKGSYNLSDTNDYVFFRKVADQQADCEPDIYYLSIAGLSAKFCIDSLGQFHSIPASNIKILSSPFSPGGTGSSTQWIVADDKGNIYYFGSNTAGVPSGTVGVETSYTGSPTGPHVEYVRPTAWYITKIITANQVDTIYFTYKQKVETYWLQDVVSYSYANDNSIGYPVLSSFDQQMGFNSLLFDGQNSPGAHNASQTGGISALTGIQWRGGSISFASNTRRQDIEDTTGYDNMLDSIVVYNTAGTVIKAYSLNYNDINQRYYLSTLMETGQPGSPVLPYTFGYISPNQLPLRGSYSQDHWGFYNGAGNSNPLPFSNQMPVNSMPVFNANRNPDSVLMQYGTLNSINYPTGGTTNFSYEANHYNPSTVIAGNAPWSTVVSQVQYVAGDTVKPFAQSSTISIPFPQSVNLVIDFNNYAHPPQANMSTLPYVSLYQQNGNGTLTLVGYWDAYDDFPTTTPTPNSNGLYNFTYTVNNIALSAAGTYILVASDSCLRLTSCAESAGQPAQAYATAGLTYSGYETAPPGGSAPLPLAGGLRIKKITNYNANGSFVDAKQYIYAPGNLLMYPQYVIHTEQDVTAQVNAAGESGNETQGFPIPGPVFIDVMKETSTSQVVLGETQGVPVGYPQVTEQELDSLGNDKGYTSYTFSYFPDSLNVYNFDFTYTPWNNTTIMNPLNPVNSFEYKRGFLLEKDTYKKGANGSYIKLQSLANNYNYNDYNSTNHYGQIRGLRLQRLRSTPGYLDGPVYDGYTLPVGVPFSPDFGYAFYNVLTSWIQQVSTMETDYDQNGQNPVVKVTSTYYDNPVHMLPTRTVTNRSNQDSLVSLVNYPQDYATGTPFIDSLVSHNIATAPIENVTYQINPSGQISVLGGRVTTYLPNGKGLPSQIQLVVTPAPISLSSFKFSNVGTTGTLPFNTGTKASFSPDPTYVTRANFFNYDDYSNIAQDAKTGDFNHAYLWDYNGEYLVAQVNNAALSDIAYTSFEANGTGNWQVPDTTRIRAYSMTGTLCYGLNSGNTITASGLNSGKTYIVSYWSRAGSMTVNGTSGTLGNTVTAGGYTWNYYEHTISSATSVSVSGSAAIDELRLFPKGSLMTTYTYIPLVGMSSQCSPTNYITYYGYDGLSRLNVVRDMRGNIIKTYNYNYMLK